jgi:hypothetical protein
MWCMCSKFFIHYVVYVVYGVDMQVKEVAVCRIFNTGNYENTRIEVRLALDPLDETNTSILTAEKIILDYWANKKEVRVLEQY